MLMTIMTMIKVRVPMRLEYGSLFTDVKNGPFYVVNITVSVCVSLSVCLKVRCGFEAC